MEDSERLEFEKAIAAIRAKTERKGKRMSWIARLGISIGMWLFKHGLKKLETKANAKAVGVYFRAKVIAFLGPYHIRAAKTTGMGDDMVAEGMQAFMAITDEEMFALKTMAVVEAELAPEDNPTTMK